MYEVLRCALWMSLNDIDRIDRDLTSRKRRALYRYENECCIYDSTRWSWAKGEATKAPTHFLSNLLNEMSRLTIEHTTNSLSAPEYLQIGLCRHEQEVTINTRLPPW